MLGPGGEEGLFGAATLGGEMRTLAKARGGGPPGSDLVIPNLGPSGQIEQEKKISTLDVIIKDQHFV